MDGERADGVVGQLRAVLVQNGEPPTRLREAQRALGRGAGGAPERNVEHSDIPSASCSAVPVTPVHCARRGSGSFSPAESP
jgi:hypothetical protein